MSDYNQYVTSINKIFDYLAKMKAGWSGQDNNSYIEKIEAYQNMVTTNAEAFKKPPSQIIEEEAEDNAEEATEAETEAQTEAVTSSPAAEAAPPTENGEAQVPAETPIEQTEPQQQVQQAPAQTESLPIPQVTTAPVAAAAPVEQAAIPQVAAAPVAALAAPVVPQQQVQQPTSPIPSIVPQQSAPVQTEMAQETGATSVVKIPQVGGQS